jgi:tetratricopeptide (TPR) repeat protein
MIVRSSFDRTLPQTSIDTRTAPQIQADKRRQQELMGYLQRIAAACGDVSDRPPLIRLKVAELYLEMTRLDIKRRHLEDALISSVQSEKLLRMNIDQGMGSANAAPDTVTTEGIIDLAAELKRLGQRERERSLLELAERRFQVGSAEWTDARRRLGLCYCDPEFPAYDPARAADIVEAIAQHNSGYGELEFLRALTVYRLGENVAALCWFDSVVRDAEEAQYPNYNFAEDYFYLSAVNAQLGRLHPAQQYYDRAMRWLADKPAEVRDDLRSLNKEARQLLTELADTNAD